MKINKLTIALEGTPASGQAFARHFAQALGETPALQTTGGYVANIQVPQVHARPGESPRALARRTAAAVSDALIAAKGRVEK